MIPEQTITGNDLDLGLIKGFDSFMAEASLHNHLQDINATNRALQESLSSTTRTQMQMQQNEMENLMMKQHCDRMMMMTDMNSSSAPDLDGSLLLAILVFFAMAVGLICMVASVW